MEEVLEVLKELSEIKAIIESTDEQSSENIDHDLAMLHDAILTEVHKIIEDLESQIDPTGDIRKSLK